MRELTINKGVVPVGHSSSTTRKPVHLPPDSSGPLLWLVLDGIVKNVAALYQLLPHADKLTHHLLVLQCPWPHSCSLSKTMGATFLNVIWIMLCLGAIVLIQMHRYGIVDADGRIGSADMEDSDPFGKQGNNSYLATFSLL